MRVVVNGSDVTVGQTVQNWSELLMWLDEQCAVEGLVVSDVMFEGVGLPTFREPEEGRRTVTGARIDVWAVSLGRLIDSAIDDALGAADPLEQAARALAARYRALDLSGVERDLAEFAAGLSSFLVLTANISDLAAQTGGAAQSVAQGTVLVAELTTHVNGLIEAQASADNVTVADILEFDVVDALHKCVSLLTAARDVAMATPAAA